MSGGWRRYGWLVALVLGLLAGQGRAQETLMVRTAQPFEATMGVLQQTLAEYGYAVAHVQRCDGGMADFGYKSDFYRVVFFGKLGEVRDLSARHPELIPYLPLKILLFAEQDETVLVALNPLALAERYDARELQVQFLRWHSDISAILQEVRSFQPPHQKRAEDRGPRAEVD
jgi:uncharacterized protein (DUF302 family)